MLRPYRCQTTQKPLNLSLTLVLCLLSLIPPIYFSTRARGEVIRSASLSIPEGSGILKRAGTPGNSSNNQNKRDLGSFQSTLPVSFEANHGQTQPQVKFISRGKGYNLFLTSTEAILCLNETSRLKTPERLPNKKDYRLQQGVLRMKLEGADSESVVTGLDESEGKVNYFLGSKAEQWQTNIPTYAKVQYHNVYPGIDLIYHGSERQIEHDFVIAPGADHRLIQLSFKGADAVRLDAHDNLVFSIQGKRVGLSKPRLYQIVDGREKDVPGGYVLHKRHRVSFQVGSYDRTIPLVIDPVLVYSTYVGGEGMDEGNGIAVDRAGNVYVTGSTFSAAFPPALSLTAPPQDSIGGICDAFLFKLSPDGRTLLYRTYLGGSSAERGLGIAVDHTGSAYITGWTASPNFPPVNSLQSYAGGGRADAFVTKLNPRGSSILFSTYLGGSADDVGSAMAVDNAGNIFVSGTTVSRFSDSSTPFPTTPGSFATTHHEGARERGISDAFVTKLNISLGLNCINIGGTGDCSIPSIVYSTYLGGNGADAGNGIAIDTRGNAYVTGTTNSSNFPTANPLQATLGGGRCRNGSDVTDCSDVFVTQLSVDGSRLEYSTYLGGTGTDGGNAIAVSNLNHVYITGETTGDFPIRDAFGSTFRGGATDAFVTQLNNMGHLSASSYLGGSGDDKGAGIAVDSAHNIYLTGTSSSSNFDSANQLQPLTGARGSCDTGTPGLFHPCTDAFATKLNPGGRELIYSTLLGGNKDDEGRSIAVDNSGNAYITGLSSSTGSGRFPIANPLQASLNGVSDVIVAKISDAVDVDPPASDGNVIADAIEVTQAIQDLNNSIRLVADKRTFVRFHVHTNGVSFSTRAKLTVERGGVSTTLNAINPGGSIVVLPSPMREVLNHAFLFELPSNMISEGPLTLTAEVNPADPSGRRSLPESIVTDNTIQTSVSFQTAIRFNVSILNVGYVMSGTTFSPANSHADKLESWLRRAYPISDLQVSHGNMDYVFGFAGPPDCGTLNAQLFTSWVWNHRHLVLIPGDMRYYGMVDDGGQFMRGCAPVSGNIASGPTGTSTFGWDFDGSYGDWYGGHELGHAYGRFHVLGEAPGGAQCGTESGGILRHPNGRISGSLAGSGSIFGFDVATLTILPPTSGDVMTYCNNQWVSDFTYNGLFPPTQGKNLLRDLYPALAAANSFPRAPFSGDIFTPTSVRDAFSSIQGSEDRLLVSGVIDPKTNKATLLPSFLLPNANKLTERVPGNYSIILRDSVGNELASYPFTPARLEGGPSTQKEPERSVDSLLITELVPWVAGTAEINIAAGPHVIGAIKSGPSLPAVRIISPNGGENFAGKTIKVSWEASDEDKDPLSFHVLYSTDRGASWRILASYLTGNNIELDTAYIPGSKEALFQVVATDGIHSVSDESDGVFNVVNHPPIAKITSPDKSVVAVTGQTITFEATALKDGATMPVKQLTWTSNISGVLGYGERLSTADLKAGKHEIIFTADDDKGGVVSDSFAVTVVEDWGKLRPVPNAVRAGPALITFNPAAGDVKALVSIDNDNSVPHRWSKRLNSLTWYATTHAPWLTISTTKGTTPDQIVIGFKDTGLSEGIHTSFVTFTNASSPKQTSTVRIRVIIGAKKGEKPPK